MSPVERGRPIYRLSAGGDRTVTEAWTWVLRAERDTRPRPFPRNLLRVEDHQGIPIFWTNTAGLALGLTDNFSFRGSQILGGDGQIDIGWQNPADRTTQPGVWFGRDRDTGFYRDPVTRKLVIKAPYGVDFDTPASSDRSKEHRRPTPPVFWAP